MSEKNVCKRCRTAGARSLVPYKIIEDIDGQSVRFKGQLCEKCFNEIFGPPQPTEDTDEKKN